MPHLDLKPTLVMGASGSVGRHVLRSLVADGLPVRASSRRPRPGQLVDGVAVCAADLTDPDSLRVAFEGVAQVFLYAHPGSATDVLDAARAAGVERLVLMSSGSVIHPGSRGNAITEEHRQVEDEFAAANDVTVVPVRPLVLATNALSWAHTITASRPLSLYLPDAVTAPVHERDIAAVAVAALRGRADVSGMLTGPARLSQREQVAMIGTAIGEGIQVVELARDEAFAQLARFMPPGEAEAVLQFLDDAAAGHSPATSTVQDVLGRPATDFETWAADHAADYR